MRAPRHAIDRPAVLPRGSHTGFTLTELLIGIAISGILAAGVVGVLWQQNQFYGKTDDMIFAGESLRATTELVPSELRMASGQDVKAAEPDSVQVRFDVMRALVCYVDGSDVDLFVVDRATNVNLPSDRGTAWRDPFDGTSPYHLADGFDATGTQNSTARLTTCPDAGHPLSLADDRYRRVTWAPADKPAQGSFVRVYGYLTYHFQESSFGGGLALWRNDQELVAPFASADAGFEYLVCPPSSSCTWQNQVSDKSDQRDIERIRIRATAIGSGEGKFDVAADLAYDVALRNSY